MGSQFCRHSQSHPAGRYPPSSLLVFLRKVEPRLALSRRRPRRRTRSPQFQVGYGDIQRVLCSPPISLRTSRRLGGRELGSGNSATLLSVCHLQFAKLFGLLRLEWVRSRSQCQSSRVNVSFPHAPNVNVNYSSPCLPCIFTQNCHIER